MTTNTKPYANINDEGAVFLNIVRAVPPAKADALPVPVDIQIMLECCWGRDVERPTAQECHDLLVDMISCSAYGEAQGQTHPTVYRIPVLTLFHNKSRPGSHKAN